MRKEYGEESFTQNRAFLPKYSDSPNLDNLYILKNNAKINIQSTIVKKL